MGIDSRRLPGAEAAGEKPPKGLPLLARFSAARSTSVGDALAESANHSTRLSLLLSLPLALPLPRAVVVFGSPTRYLTAYVTFAGLPFSLQRTVKLRDKGIGLVPVHGRAGAWVHVTRCPAAAVEAVAGT